jgi:ATP-dependent Lon protease
MRAPEDLGTALDVLPVFPLPQTVLFPGAMLPLHIFEPRYRAMTRDALTGPKLLAIALLRENEKLPSGQPAFAPVAGIGRIIEHAKLADGRYNILLEGIARARLEEHAFVPPYRRVRATLLPSLPGSPATCDVTAMLASATAFAADIRARDPDFDFQLPSRADAGTIADLAAHHLVLDAAERQVILEMVDPVARVRRTAEALAVQHAALQRTTRGGVVH